VLGVYDIEYLIAIIRNNLWITEHIIGEKPLIGVVR